MSKIRCMEFLTLWVKSAKTNRDVVPSTAPLMDYRKALNTKGVLTLHALEIGKRLFTFSAFTEFDDGSFMKFSSTSFVNFMKTILTKQVRAILAVNLGYRCSFRIAFNALS